MKKVIWLLFVSLLVFQSVCLGSEASSRYQQIASYKEETIFFDTTTIKFAYQNNTHIVDVWFYYDYNKSGVQEEISSRKKHNLSVDGYKELSYSWKHYQFNLNDNTTATLSYTDYKGDGTILENYHFVYLTWHPIVPGSVCEEWFNAISTYSVTHEQILKQRS